MTEDDIPFILDLLERLSGKKWHEEYGELPSMEEILLGTMYMSVGDVLTGHFRGKSASTTNSRRAMHTIAKRIRDQLQ